MVGFNDTLNNIIAVVVVILILSLVVQSVQSLVKKLFKIKSRQIEESLVDLFANLLNKPRVQPKKWLDKMVDHSPMWRMLVFWRARCSAAEDVENIYKTVVTGFKDVGRLAQSGKHMLDSISKGDLLKILEKVPIRDLLPSFARGVEDAVSDIAKLEQVISGVKAAVSNGYGSDAFQTIADDFISMELLLAPVFNDVKAILKADKVSDPQTAGSPNVGNKRCGTSVLVRDISLLTEIDSGKLQKLLEDMRMAVSEARKTAAADPPLAKALEDLEAGLHQINASLDGLRLRLGPAVNAFRRKTKEASQWYDIVMQSFEERYNRSMKSFAMVIAFLVVVMLNANFFNVYRNIASSEVTRNLLVDKGGEVLKLSRERNQPENQPGATENQSSNQPASRNEAAAQGPRTPPTAKSAEERSAEEASLAQADREQLKQAREEFNAALQLVKSDAELYKGIGFSPLRVQQVKDFFSSLTPDKGTADAWDGWVQARKHDI